MNDTTDQGDFLMGNGVIAECIAFVPGKAIIDGQFHGAIDSKKLVVQKNGTVSGTCQSAEILVAGQLLNSVHALNTLHISSTGQVGGNISYGNLEVERGGEILGAITPFIETDKAKVS